MQSFKSAVFVVACVLAVVGCDEESAASERVALEGDAGSNVELDPTPDAGAMLDPVADAGPPVLADAGQAPTVVTDAGSPVVPAVDAALPVVEPPRCTTTFYADVDRDGFGDPATALASCSRPDGYVDNASDCYDRNALAKPGQQGRLGEHRGDGSFDYDCDGIERPISDKLVSCPDFTAQDHQCRPPHIKYMAGDPVQIDDCYEVISSKVDRARDGDPWWQVVPACGQVGARGLNLAWSRESGYTCVRTVTAHVTQVCN